jgi:hypothetical protein
MTTAFADGPAADPTGAKTAALFAKYAAPADVLSASVDDLIGRPAVGGYADPGTNTYPIHTKAAVWASVAAYHDNGRPDSGPVADRLKAACAFWRMGDAWAEMKEAALVSRPGVIHYAIPYEKRYPLDRPEQLKAAAAYLEDHRGSFSPEEARTFASSLLARNAVLGVLTAGEKVAAEITAGYGTPAADWRDEFSVRTTLAKAAGDNELVAAVKAAEAAVDGGADPYAAADLLRQVDRRMKWALPDPAGRLTAVTPSAKWAAATAHARAADGSWYRVADLAAVPADAWDAVLGGGVVSAAAKRAAALADPATFPAAARLLADHGVRPAEAAPEVLPKTDWAAAAA